MTDYCNNCNGTGWVRDGYDGEAPCDWCRPEDYQSWIADQVRQTENMLLAYRELCDKQAAELKELHAILDKTCQWKYFEADDYWETSCGEMYVFEFDGPAENSQVYCPKCRGKIELLSTRRDPK